MLPGWIPLAAFARERGVPPKTMRRRLLALDHAEGGGLLRSFHRSGRPRKYWVHPERVRKALEADPDAREAELDWLASRVEKLEQSCAVLKKAHRELKKRLFVVSPPTA